MNIDKEVLLFAASIVIGIIGYFIRENQKNIADIQKKYYFKQELTLKIEPPQTPSLSLNLLILPLSLRSSLENVSF
jgi:hypothetical protein